MELDQRATQLDAERAEVLRQLKALQENDADEQSPARPSSASQAPGPARRNGEAPPALAIPTHNASYGSSRYPQLLASAASPTLSHRLSETPAPASSSLLGPAASIAGPGPELDPQSALNQLLLACENEVRECKGYVLPGVTPMKVARCRPGQMPSPDATYLSRPEGTSVDFTLPVDIKGYRDIIKKPVTLNMIRSRCRSGKYQRYEEFLEDMRLLARNTRKFNTDSAVQWIVQHSELLLEAAEEAVQTRKRALVDAEEALAKRTASHRTSTRGNVTTKRKRDTAGAAERMEIGMLIETCWDADKRWHKCRVAQEDRENGRFGIVYTESRVFEWIDPSEVRWRPQAKHCATLEHVENLRGEVLGRMDDARFAVIAELRSGSERVESAVIGAEKLVELENGILRVTRMLKDTISEQAIEIQALREKLFADLGCSSPRDRPTGREHEKRDDASRAAEEGKNAPLSNVGSPCRPAEAVDPCLQATVAAASNRPPGNGGGQEEAVAEQTDVETAEATAELVRSSYGNGVRQAGERESERDVGETQELTPPTQGHAFDATQASGNVIERDTPVESLTETQPPAPA